MNVQVVIVLLKVLDRNIKDMLPDRSVAAVSLLKEFGSLLGFLTVLLVLLRSLAGERVDLLELRDGERSFLRVLSCE